MFLVPPPFIKVAAAGGGFSMDVSAASYDSVSLSVTSQESSPLSMCFSADYSKMYIGGAGRVIYQYTLPTPGSLASGSYASKSLSCAGQISSGGVQAISFSDDGGYCYISSGVPTKIHRYTLSTSWDISTGSFSGDYDYSSQVSGCYGLHVTNDGTKMYLNGTLTDAVKQFTLSTPHAISTASYASKSFSTNTENTTPAGLWMSSDGGLVLQVGVAGDEINQYSLSTPFDASTGAFVSGGTFVTTSQDGAPYQVCVSETHSKMFVLGNSNDTVYQYSI